MRRTLDIVPEPLKKYAGMRPPIEEQRHRAYHLAFTLLSECLGGGDTAFGRLCRNLLLLNEETEPLIYGGQFGFIDKPYVSGTRPLLEKYIADHTSPDMSDVEKVIALNQSTANLPKEYGCVPYFLYGESDEQTILKGGGHCSCQGRLLTALCQVIGLQARPVIMWVCPDAEDPAVVRGGHTVTEVYLDGRWCVFDPSGHWYCQTPDGYIPSFKELRDNFEDLVGQMTDEQLKKMQVLKGRDKDPRESLAKYRQTYMPANVPLAYSRHDVNTDYEVHWTWVTPQFQEAKQHDYAQFKQISHELADRGELTDDIFQLNVDGFRDRFNIADAQLPSLGPALV